MKPNKKFAVVAIVFSVLYMIAGICCIAIQKVFLTISGVNMGYYDGPIIPWLFVFRMVLCSVITIVLAAVAIRQNVSTEGNGVVLLVLSIVYVAAMPIVCWGLDIVNTWQISLLGVSYTANYNVISTWLGNVNYLLDIAVAFLMIQVGLNYSKLNMLKDIANGTLA